VNFVGILLDWTEVVEVLKAKLLALCGQTLSILEDQPADWVQNGGVFERADVLIQAVV